MLEVNLPGTVCEKVQNPLLVRRLVEVIVVFHQVEKLLFRRQPAPLAPQKPGDGSPAAPFDGAGLVNQRKVGKRLVSAGRLTCSLLVNAFVRYGPGVASFLGGAAAALAVLWAAGVPINPWFRENRVELFQGSLRGAKLERLDLFGARLPEANLRCASLAGTNLESADLRLARLEVANLAWVRLKGADLRGANLRCACLVFADLSEANLAFANLESADLETARLQNADLTSATYNADTVWPESYDPEAAGARRVPREINPFQPAQLLAPVLSLEPAHARRVPTEANPLQHREGAAGRKQVRRARRSL